MFFSIFFQKNRLSINRTEWQKVLKVRDKEAHFKELLEQVQDERFTSEEFCYKFLKKNKKWISNHCSMIFTPRTIQL